MAKAYCTNEQFKQAWQETGGKLETIRQRFGFGSIRAVSNRRVAIEKQEGILLNSASPISTRNSETRKKNSRRIELDIPNGVVLVGSDAHVWDEPLTTAQRGFIWAAKTLKPHAIILNGDIVDGAKISNHPAGIWDQEDRPDVQSELKGVHAFVDAIWKAAPVGTRRIWTLGNHDARLEYQLAAKVPQYKGVPGFALKDHFPEWTFCMAVFVNDNTVVKHRFKNGRHAPENNALWAGRSMVTGHLHSQKVQPVTDYNETRYGVDSGCLADPESKQFDYTEENPTGWRSGFAVLTYRDGKLLHPELVSAWGENAIQFRGAVISV